MKIVGFGAHPDDVEVGMGGAIAEYTRREHDVFIVVATIPNDQEIRRREARKAAQILGAKLIILDIEFNDLIFSRKLVQRFDEVIVKCSADIIYTHWVHDSHQDHVAVANAAVASARKNRCSLYMYEQTIPGGIVPYDFRAQSYIDISKTIQTKLKSISAYESQLEKNGDKWLHGIKGRATLRGYQINVAYAEAFEVVKQVKQP